MIVAISLNPALDVTYRLDSPLEIGGTNRVSNVAIRPGGKALNVARVLQHLHHSVRVVAPLGGPTGDLIRHEAAGHGLDGAWVEVASETRRTVVSWEAGSGVATTLSEPGSLLTTSEWYEISAAVQRLLPADMLVISGSVAPGLPDDAIAQLVGFGRSSGTRVVVDTSSPTLATVIEAGATIVKPNRGELVALLGRAVGGTSNDLVIAAEELRAGRGIAVVVSDGPSGLIAVTPTGRWRARPPLIHGANATGAGDACVAGLVAATLAGDGWPQVVRFAAALGAAAARQPVAGEVGDYQDLYTATHVEEL